MPIVSVDEVRGDAALTLSRRPRLLYLRPQLLCLGLEAQCVLAELLLCEDQVGEAVGRPANVTPSLVDGASLLEEGGGVAQARLLVHVVPSEIEGVLTHDMCHAKEAAGAA